LLLNNTKKVIGGLVGQPQDSNWNKIYMVKLEPHPCLFFPNSSDNINKYITYCGEVDHVFWECKKPPPQYAWKYFAYKAAFTAMKSAAKIT
jgi:hypothetical protein